jgi:hypothetical protein
MFFTAGFGRRRSQRVKYIVDTANFHCKIPIYSNLYSSNSHLLKQIIAYKIFDIQS